MFVFFDKKLQANGEKMEWLIVALIVGVLYIISKGKKQKNKNATYATGSSSVAKNSGEKIRKGYQIFVSNMSVEGIQFRKDVVNQFIDDSNQRIKLEAEPSNQADENAIKIVGEGDRGKYHLGYVSKEVALKLAKTECLPYVYARLMRIYRGEQKFIDITYQIVGQKDKKEQFESYEKNLPITSAQKEYLKFWKIKFNENITTSEAHKLIAEHYEGAKSNEPQKFIEWERLECIREAYDYLSDKDEREQYFIKKPTKKQIEISMDELLKVGIKCEAIQDDYQILVDKLIDINPQLES